MPTAVRGAVLAAVSAVAIVMLAPAGASADSPAVPVSCDSTTCTIQFGGGYVAEIIQGPSSLEICEGLATNCHANSVTEDSNGLSVWLNGAGVANSTALIAYLSRGVRVSHTPSARC